MSGLPTILLAPFPEFHPFLWKDGFKERVVFPFVPVLPSVAGTADADDEPSVVVGRAVGSSDEVVGLEDFILAVSYASENTSFISFDNNSSDNGLYLIFEL